MSLGKQLMTISENIISARGNHITTKQQIQDLCILHHTPFRTFSLPPNETLVSLLTPLSPPTAQGKLLIYFLSL